MCDSTLTQQSADYDRIASSIAWLEANFRRQPTLTEIADHATLSKYHFQRLFKRWVGISPTQFMHYLTVEYAKERLAANETLLDTTYAAGLSSTGRLHDLFIHFEAMTPGDYKRQAAELRIRYGFHATPFGLSLIGITERGICGMHFCQDAERDGALALLQHDWQLASFVEDPSATAPYIDQIFDPFLQPQAPLPLLVKGTNFQINVWRALLRIPVGEVVTYQQVASSIGSPSAYRAAATAIASNRIGFLIPCHRVINKVGQVSKYRWGGTRKRLMLGYEAAQVALGD